MNNKNAIFAILGIIVIVIVVFVIAVKFLPQKEQKNGITGYQTPSVFDITGFFTNTIKNTVETIQNIGSKPTSTTGNTGTIAPDTREADQTASSILQNYLA